MWSRVQQLNTTENVVLLFVATARCNQCAKCTTQAGANCIPSAAPPWRRVSVCFCVAALFFVCLRVCASTSRRGHGKCVSILKSEPNYFFFFFQITLSFLAGFPETVKRSVFFCFPFVLIRRWKRYEPFNSVVAFSFTVFPLLFLSKEFCGGLWMCSDECNSRVWRQNAVRLRNTCFWLMNTIYRLSSSLVSSDGVVAPSLHSQRHSYRPLCRYESPH